nr:polysaccharide pyruvyl transferase family protein [uncultured Faecalimonas sp.]
MKYARIDIETIGFANKLDKAHINFGDHLQNIVIKDLYAQMGIPEEDIYVLDFNEISTYEGETLLLPINQAISHTLNTFISPKIIPVFLGISRDTTAITEEEKEYLKNYTPIGCRDEALHKYLTSNNIENYLNGCLTVTLDKRMQEPEDGKIYVIEAPAYALEAMPDKLKKNAIYLENTFYGTYDELVKNTTLEEVVRARYQLLKDTASVVITSRMHIASPCIGMGIPVILVRNSIDYRFSWIDKYIPVYTARDVNNINWSPKSVELSSVKELLLENAKQCIRSSYNKFKKISEITDFYENRNKVTYDLPQFSKKVIDFVSSRWEKQEEWNYAIWGENDASERLYNFLTNNYPNARFVDFYDSYKQIKYHGQIAKHPSCINVNDNIFIFVTGYTATDAAKELFTSIGKDPSMYYLFGEVVRGY